MALTKVSGDILDTGIVVAGIVTATEFVGAGLSISGISTFVGVATFKDNAYVDKELYVGGIKITTGGGTVAIGTDIVTRNIKATGVSTFVGDVQFDGDVSIGGTLTYQDVTNVDSVGLGTFRNGIHVTAGVSTFLGGVKIGPTNTNTRAGVINIGGAGALSYTDNDGSSGNVATVLLENSYGAANSDIHVKQRGDFEVQNLQGNAILRVDTAWTNASINSGNVYLNYKSNASGSSVLTRLSTTSTGVDIDTGDLTITSGSLVIPDSIIHSGDTDTKIRFSGADTIQLETGGSSRLKIDANGVVQVTRRLELTNSGDNHYVYQGRAWAWSSNGTSTGTIRGYLYGDSSGNLRIGANSDWGEDLRITSGGSLKLPDDGKIELGGAQDVAGDLQIYHTSGHTWLKNSTGYLRFATDASGFTFSNADNTQAIAQFVKGGSCELYHNNSRRFGTTTTGITAYGEVAATQDYPNYRPALDFNFAAVKKLDSRITYTRTGPASYTDEFGKVVLVGNNVPRFDHDPVTRESKGLLIEESRTNNNKCVMNQWEFTGWSDSKFNREYYGSETAPDESTNVTLVYPNTDNDSHYVYVSHAGNGLTGVRTCSAWFKKFLTVENML